MINLTLNNGFKWSSSDRIYFKGFIREPNGNILHGQKALTFFSAVNTLEDLKSVLEYIDGLFSIIIKFEGVILFAVDRVRTFPLFYHLDSFDISDTPLNFKDFHISESHTQIFKSLGYTIGKKTLFKNILQLEAGTIGQINNGHFKQSEYYSYLSDKTSLSSFEELKSEFKTLLFKVFEDFVSSLNGKPVAVSLSGGYDSRMIAMMLRHFNYKNVHCFTYGRKQNEELSNSERTAELLGYPWQFIEYDASLAEGLLEDNEFLDYSDFAGKACSMPYLQDYFAIRHLKKTGSVPEDSVFITGHSGDFIGGSHLKGRIKQDTSDKQLASLLFNSNFTLQNYPEKRQIIDQIENELSQQEAYPHLKFENWDFKERQAKFIVNSASVYDYFGHEYRMPFWDVRLMEFFKSVPFEHKNFKRLFDSVFVDLFKEYDLNFDDELQPSQLTVQIQNCKDVLKKVLPKAIKQQLTGKSLPWHAYDVLTLPMKRELESIGAEPVEDYNGIISSWYLSRVAEKSKRQE